jgi:hypothetical protein
MKETKRVRMRKSIRQKRERKILPLAIGDCLLLLFLLIYRVPRDESEWRGVE